MALNNRHPYSRGFFLLLMAGVGYLSFILVRPFLSVIILAFLASLFFRRPFLSFCRATNGRKKLSLTLTWVTILITLFIPLFLFGKVLISQLIFMARDLENLDLTQQLSLTTLEVKANTFLAQIPGVTTRIQISDLEKLAQDAAQFLGSYAFNKSMSLGSAGVSLITDLIIFVILFSTFIIRQEDLITLLKRLSPLESRLNDMYVNRVLAMAAAMMRGTFLIAICQGVMAGIFFYFAGVHYVLFWSLITILASLVPVGASLVTLLISLVLFVLGNFWQGLLVLAGTVLVINNVDNILRAMLVPDEAQLHPALVLLSVIGGISLFGLWGVIYGPVIMILLTTTLEIYLEQY